MITQLEVRTPRVVTSVPFNEDGTIQNDPIQIRDVDGLGPVTADLGTTQYGVIDGAVYNGGLVGQRNIVITFGLNPDYENYTVQALRELLYSYFMPKNEVTLTFHRDNMPDCEIDGYVESMQTNIFAKEPEVQVSILCPYPYFTDVIQSVTTGIAIAVDGVARVNIPYMGNVPSGFVLTASMAAATYSGVIKMINSAPTPETFLTTTTVIDATHRFEISTILGSKYVRHVNPTTGVPTNLMGLVVQSSEWPQLYPGPNSFAFMAGTTQTWSLRYFNRYGGI